MVKPAHGTLIAKLIYDRPHHQPDLSSPKKIITTHDGRLLPYLPEGFKGGFDVF